MEGGAKDSKVLIVGKCCWISFPGNMDLMDIFYIHCHVTSCCPDGDRVNEMCIYGT